MRKSTALGLTALVLGSVAVRLSPLWSFLYWGSDTGEYFAILRDLVRTGHVSTTYDGWGVTYPYFPGMFFLQGGLAHLSGLDLPTVLNVLVPILGALSVVPIFLIARRVTGEDRVALFAAAVLVGAIPHAYTTAHPAPATVGNLLALTGLLLFLRLRTDRAALVPLAVVSGTLIATHHLSLYFFLLMVLGTIIVQGLARPWRWTAGSKREVAYASLLLAGTFVYWLVYATTFREFILTDVDIRPWWALLVLFGLGLVFLGGIIYARTRIGWRYRPRYPGLRYRGTAYASAVGVILILGIVSVLFGVPGTTFRVSPEGLLYFVPLVLLISFSAPGRKFLDFDRDGLPVNAWLSSSSNLRSWGLSSRHASSFPIDTWSTSSYRSPFSRVSALFASWIWEQSEDDSESSQAWPSAWPSWRTRSQASHRPPPWPVGGRGRSPRPWIPRIGLEIMRAASSCRTITALRRSSGSAD